MLTRLLWAPMLVEVLLLVLLASVVLTGCGMKLCHPDDGGCVGQAVKGLSK